MTATGVAGKQFQDLTGRIERIRLSDIKDGGIAGHWRHSEVNLFFCYSPTHRRIYEWKESVLEIVSMVA